MRLLKLFVLSLFLSLITCAKGSNLVFHSVQKFVYENKPVLNKKIIFQLKAKGHFKILSFKRKSRTKGVKVAVPYISALTFVAEYFYTDYNSPFVFHCFYSHEISSNPKRGPPGI